MAVDYKAGWDGHDARQKCGIITSAHVDGKKLLVSGYLYARDFPHFVPYDALTTPADRKHPPGAPVRAKASAHGESMPDVNLLGMSYELAEAHVADMRAPVWTLTRATFTGAAILLREKAAYRGTSFRLKRHAGTSRRP